MYTDEIYEYYKHYRLLVSVQDYVISKCDITRNNSLICNLPISWKSVMFYPIPSTKRGKLIEGQQLDTRRNGQLPNSNCPKVSLPKTSTRAMWPFYVWVDFLASWRFVKRTFWWWTTSAKFVAKFGHKKSKGQNQWHSGLHLYPQFEDLRSANAVGTKREKMAKKHSWCRISKYQQHPCQSI